MEPRKTRTGLPSRKPAVHILAHVSLIVNKCIDSTVFHRATDEILNVLLERLKLLWLGFEIVKHFIDQKREKAMIEALEQINHRLIQLEEKKKEIP
ncbi:MAG TPA: hypothetical protein VL325_00300 [Pyrinomonadaceae bacterium]|nr:hypothetical protein [Pyrinomonadaceae bacterium]